FHPCIQALDQTDDSALLNPIYLIDKYPFYTPMGYIAMNHLILVWSDIKDCGLTGGVTDFPMWEPYERGILLVILDPLPIRMFKAIKLTFFYPDDLTGRDPIPLIIGNVKGPVRSFGDTIGRSKAFGYKFHFTAIFTDAHHFPPIFHILEFRTQIGSQGGIKTAVLIYQAKGKLVIMGCNVPGIAHLLIFINDPVPVQIDQFGEFLFLQYIYLTIYYLYSKWFGKPLGYLFYLYGFRIFRIIIF